jgi:hypothetical protein
LISTRVTLFRGPSGALGHIFEVSHCAGFP